MRNLTYLEFAPHNSLKEYINCYWYFDFKNFNKQSIDVIPDGYFDLLFITDGERVTILLTGLWEELVSISYFKPARIFAVRFRPQAAGHLVPFPLNSIINSTIEASFQDINMITDYLISGNIKELLVFFENYYISKLNSIKKIGRINSILSYIESYRGCKSMEEISREFKISSRQIQRIVTQNTGLSPKKYSRIVRFRDTYLNNDLMLYYDQSHHIKEFKKFAGKTPDNINSLKDLRFLQRLITKTPHCH